MPFCFSSAAKDIAISDGQTCIEKTKFNLGITIRTAVATPSMSSGRHFVEFSILSNGGLVSVGLASQFFDAESTIFNLVDTFCMNVEDAPGDVGIVRIGDLKDRASPLFPGKWGLPCDKVRLLLDFEQDTLRVFKGTTPLGEVVTYGLRAQGPLRWAVQLQKKGDRVRMRTLTPPAAADQVAKAITPTSRAQQSGLVQCQFKSPDDDFETVTLKLRDARLTITKESTSRSIDSSICGCRMVRPKPVKKQRGHEHMMRLDLACPDVDGNENYILSFHTRGELVDWCGALSTYRFVELADHYSWCKIGATAKHEGTVGTLTMAPDFDNDVRLQWAHGGLSGYKKVFTLEQVQHEPEAEPEAEPEPEPELEPESGGSSTAAENAAVLAEREAGGTPEPFSQLSCGSIAKYGQRLGVIKEVDDVRRARLTWLSTELSYPPDSVDQFTSTSDPIELTQLESASLAEVAAAQSSPYLQSTFRLLTEQAGTCVVLDDAAAFGHTKVDDIDEQLLVLDSCGAIKWLAAKLVAGYWPARVQWCQEGMIVYVSDKKYGMVCSVNQQDTISEIECENIAELKHAVFKVNAEIQWFTGERTRESVVQLHQATPTEANQHRLLVDVCALWTCCSFEHDRAMSWADFVLGLSRINKDHATTRLLLEAIENMTTQSKAHLLQMLCGAAENLTVPAVLKANSDYGNQSIHQRIGECCADGWDVEVSCDSRVYAMLCTSDDDAHLMEECFTNVSPTKLKHQSDQDNQPEGKLVSLLHKCCDNPWQLFSDSEIGEACAQVARLMYAPSLPLSQCFDKLQQRTESVFSRLNSECVSTACAQWPLIRDAASDLGQSILHSTQKVQSCGFRVAVIGPMKAGKSTMVNSMVGISLAPKRMEAMTQVPTVIQHVDEQRIPVMRAEIKPYIAAIRILRALGRNDSNLPGQMLAKETVNAVVANMSRDVKDVFVQLQATPSFVAKDPWLRELKQYETSAGISLDVDDDTSTDGLESVHELPEGKDTECIMTITHINNAAEAESQIREWLTRLNDLCRIANFFNSAPGCSELGLKPLVDEMFHNMPVVQVEMAICRRFNVATMGNFELVDTPGPNEAGQGSTLTDKVTQILEKSDAIICVINGKQLRNKAEQDIEQLITGACT